jgi:hypothetical protein
LVVSLLGSCEGEPLFVLLEPLWLVDGPPLVPLVPLSSVLGCDGPLLDCDESLFDCDEPLFDVPEFEPFDGMTQSSPSFAPVFCALFCCEPEDAPLSGPPLDRLTDCEDCEEPL